VNNGTVSLINDAVEFNTAQAGTLAERGGIYIYSGTVCLDAFTTACSFTWMTAVIGRFGYVDGSFRPLRSLFKPRSDVLLLSPRH
jgi:hypothetical protein